MNSDSPCDFSALLNPQQWEATRYTDGHELIIAGAGSGKTRVLTYKIAYLIAQGVNPWNILALTFTNKSAREMNERIADLVGAEAMRGLWSGTFHSIFARILRLEAASIGFRSDYTIYDAADSKSLIKTIVREMALDDKVYKASRLLNRISEAKNAIVLPEDYVRDGRIRKRDEHDYIPLAGQIYATYVQRLRAAGAMDFDDLLLNTALLFRQHPDVCDRYAARFRYILVDEYQDTNVAQYRIISLLSRPDTRICAVGDDAQSIYRFRGADISNILSFTNNFSGARIFKLERNYRSTQTIVNAANSVIRHNAGQIPKDVYSRGDEGEPLRIFATTSDKEEAARVVSEVARLHRRENVDYSEIALLYRTNAQSRSFEEAFRAAQIPYRIYGGLSFYQRKEIKDVIAYFRLVTNPDDEEAFKRIINYPARGIGATTLQKLQVAAATERASLMQVSSAPEQYGVALGTAAKKKLAGFVDMMTEFGDKARGTGCYDLALHIITRSGIMNELVSSASAEDLTRKENVEELINAVKAFETERREETGNERIPLSDYLSQVSLLTDSDRTNEDEQQVTLMTMHAAKGLEYDAVFVTGLEENIFPGIGVSAFPADLEEERRLFYVALTRAKRFCTLTYATSRFHFGKLEFSSPSRFLADIDSRYVCDMSRSSSRSLFAPRPVAPSSSSVDQLPRPRLRPVASAPSAFRPAAPPSCDELNVGDVVEHSRFGRGRVVSLEGNHDDRKAEVDFEAVGRKKLLLRFARFTRVDAGQ